MDRQIKKRANHPVTHYPCIDRNAYGDKIFGEGVELKCFRSEKVTQVRSRTGEIAVSHTQLFFDNVLFILGDDEIDYDGRMHQILAFSRFDGLKPGTGTTVIYL